MVFTDGKLMFGQITILNILTDALREIAAGANFGERSEGRGGSVAPMRGK